MDNMMLGVGPNKATTNEMVNVVLPLPTKPSGPLPWSANASQMGSDLFFEPRYLDSWCFRLDRVDGFPLRNGLLSISTSLDS